MVQLVRLAAGLMLLATSTSSLLAKVMLRQVATGFTFPVFLTCPPGDNRLFVAEKAGRIRVINNGVVQTTPYLDISGIVQSGGFSDERGLLGLAFDPNFATNRYFYVYYIESASQDSVIARYQQSPTDASTADPTETEIMRIDQPGPANHKAGWIGFRPSYPDHLYIASGDGGNSNDPSNFGQRLDTNLGKILRIDIRTDDFPADPDRNYGIPADNPFAGAITGNDEIWAYGLRNPYRNSFDRLTGDFWIADVGQNSREEVNVEPAATMLSAGRNYGWRAREGSIENPVRATDPDPVPRIEPVYEYPHSAFGGGSKSITGGYVYRGPIVAEQGKYFFADFAENVILSFTYSGAPVATADDRTPQLGSRPISSFGEDNAGNLYVVQYGDSGTGRILIFEAPPSLLAVSSRLVHGN